MGSILPPTSIEPAARVASLEKILFSNFKISRKKYSLEKQLEINHTAGSGMDITQRVTTKHLSRAKISYLPSPSYLASKLEKT